MNYEEVFRERFEYRGFRYGLSVIGKDYCFYSEKMMKLNKRQKKLDAKTEPEAHREVKSLIEEKLNNAKR